MKLDCQGLNLGFNIYKLCDLSKLVELSLLYLPQLQNVNENNSIYLIRMLCGLNS